MFFVVGMIDQFISSNPATHTYLIWKVVNKEFMDVMINKMKRENYNGITFHVEVQLGKNNIAVAGGLLLVFSWKVVKLSSHKSLTYTTWPVVSILLL